VISTNRVGSENEELSSETSSEVANPQCVGCDKYVLNVNYWMQKGKQLTVEHFHTLPWDL